MAKNDVSREGDRMNPLDSSSEILKEAIALHKPYAKVLMFSGGGDSMAAYQVCKALGIDIDFLMHINTRTGIEETTDFVRSFAESEGVRYIEADAGKAYEEYVLRKGFFGVGTGKKSAHTYAFHVVKKTAYEKALSKHIRQHKRGRKIFLINGARMSESDNRAKNLGAVTVRCDRKKPNDFWVNCIHHWSKDECRTFCSEQNAPKNPVSDLLCRSGECFCGTTQGRAAREEASYWYPSWGRWIDSLEAKVQEKFPWGWGEPIPKQWTLEKAGQMRIFDPSDFTPLCSDCIKTQSTEAIA